MGVAGGVDVGIAVEGFCTRLQSCSTDSYGMRRRRLKYEYGRSRVDNMDYGE